MLTEEERAVIVRLMDDCVARKVRHFKRGDLEFEFEKPEAKPAQRLPALSRLKAEAG